MLIERVLKEEKYAARRAILPTLQAEDDERFVSEWKKYLEEEARIMKDVPAGNTILVSGKMLACLSMWKWISVWVYS
ncbi:hypothetical protein MKX01_042634 [Papaver californicum]|nr:hypothetical protein MKX01_042634 [Papaver californicum]